MPFRRGDANGDGLVNIADGVFILRNCFIGGAVVPCADACDTNDSGSVDLADAMGIFMFVTMDSPAPRAPYPDCGDDLTVDDLRCDEYDIMRDLCAAPAPVCCPTNAEYAYSIIGGAVAVASPGTGTSIAQRVSLTVPDPSSVEGWSLSILVSGDSSCRLLDWTVDGTEAASVIEGGSLVDGFVRTELLDFDGIGPTGLISSVVLAISSHVALSASDSPFALLGLTLTGMVPGRGGCNSCTIDFSDGLEGAGEEIQNFVIDAGRSIKPTTTLTEVHFCPDKVGVVDLELGAPQGATLDPGPSRNDNFAVFKVATTAGQTLEIELTDAGEDDENALYVRYGECPTVSVYEFAAAERGRTNQKLVVPYTREGDCFILVAGNKFSGDLNEVTIEANIVDIALTAMSAESVGSTPIGSLHVRITGGGFTSQTTFSLTPQVVGSEIGTTESLVVSSSEAFVTFDVGGAVAGLYTLRADDPDRGFARIEGAFRVLPSSEPGRLDVRVVASDGYRAGRVRRLTLRYDNPGAQEVPAALLRLVADPGVVLRLESDDEFGGNVLQLLAVDPDGSPSVIPPGGSGEVGVVFRIDADEGDDERVRFDAQAFSPYREDLICWDSTVPDCEFEVAPPPGLDVGQWDALRGALEQAGHAGTRWRDYGPELARLARVAALRGLDPRSVPKVLDLALAASMGEPGGAIIGTLREPTGELVVGRVVAALDGATEVACAATNERGEFVLRGLDAGVSYAFAVDLRTVVVDPVVLASSEIRSLLDVVALADPRATPIACVPTAPVSEVEGPIEPPTELFLFVSGKEVDIIGPVDPNVKDGPAGQGDGELGRLIPPDETLRYKIKFENLAGATAPVQVASVKDTLSANLDKTSVVFGDVGFGDETVSLVPKSSASTFGGSILPLNPAGFGGFGVKQIAPNVFVAIEAEVDLSSRTIEWTFSTRDADGNVYTDDLTGFLPGNDFPPAGEAWVVFDVDPIIGIAAGEQIENQATVTFESESDCDTNTTQHEIMGPENFELPPPVTTAPENRLDRAVDLDASLKWAHPYAAASFELYLWKCGPGGDPEPTVPTATGLSGRSWLPSAGLAPATRYCWRVGAQSGEEDESSEESVFVTTGGTGLFVRGDTNGDGAVDISDAVALLGYRFLGEAAPECLDAADGNDDENVDISDAVYVLQYLFSSGPVPFAPAPTTSGWFASTGTLDCDLDPTAGDGDLDCIRFRRCEE
jgi:hypothetical protein